jgi:hypothetical protein
MIVEGAGGNLAARIAVDARVVYEELARQVLLQASLDLRRNVLLA